MSSTNQSDIWWGYFFLFAQKIKFSFDRPVSDYHWILHYFIFVWSKWIINCLIFLDLHVDDKKYKYFEKWSDINCIYWNFTCNIYKKYFITFCSLNFIIRTVHIEINIKFFFILLHINHGLCSGEYLWPWEWAKNPAGQSDPRTSTRE